MFRGVPFQFRAGPYRFVRDSCNGPQAGEYFLMGEASGVMEAGKFRLGKNDLIMDASGKSWISMEDYAVATVDELEKPQHHGERFTIGY